MQFVKIDVFRKVIKAIEADQDYIDNLPGQWLPCEGIKNYPGLGFTFDLERMAFISPKPFPSFVLNEETCQWEAPIACPNDGIKYGWDEESQSWTRTIPE